MIKNAENTVGGILRESVTVGVGTKFPLKGILTLPVSDVPVPAVVLVHGSGSSNRDEKVIKLKPFLDLAEGLAARGIAVLRYDKRSYAHPLKMLFGKGDAITVREEVIEDAVLAAELLRKDPRIDGKSVFVLGHSMGGMLAPRIDAEGGNFRGMILLAGSPRKMEEIVAEQTAEMLAQLPAVVREKSEKKVNRLLAGFEGLYSMTDEEAKKRKFGGGVTMYYFKEMGEHSVEAYLEKTDKPMLILQGSADFQVKTDRDFARYKELLSGRDNVTFRLYEGLNHAFVPTLGATIVQAKKEYGTNRPIPAEVHDDIARWIHDC